MLNPEEHKIIETVISRIAKHHKRVECIAASRIINAYSGYYVRKPYTMAKITSTEDGVTKIGVGFSKCNPTDRYNVEVGEKLAFSKACKDYIYNLIPNDQ